MGDLVPFASRDALSPAIEIEQGFLGLVLIHNETLSLLPFSLEAEEFEEPIHQHIWSAVLILTKRGSVANPTTLRGYFEIDPTASFNVGDYLRRLVTAAVHSVSAVDYAELIRDAHQRRGLARACMDAVGRANLPGVGDTAENIAEVLQGEILATVTTTKHKPTGIRAIVGALMTDTETAMRSGRPSGIVTTLADLDRKTGGFMPGEVTILAGRPSMGKSSLAGFFALAAARKNIRVAVFSLEMGDQEWPRRLLSSRIGVPYQTIRNGQMTPNDFLRFHDYGNKLAEMPIEIDDSMALTISSIRARARRYQANGGLGMVVVDHIGLVKPDSRYKGNRVHEVSEVSAGLREMAKALNVPVIALSQLNRGPEAREDKRPGLGDLRDSGSVEQDADVVMIVYREDYYLQRKEPDPASQEFADWMKKYQAVQNTTEIIVAKNRQGSVGTVRVFSDMATARYADLQPGEQRGAHSDD